MANEAKKVEAAAALLALHSLTSTLTSDQVMLLAHGGEAARAEAQRIGKAALELAGGFSGLAADLLKALDD